MEKKITVAGIGPGSLEYITKKALNCIEESHVLIGGRRNLDTFSYLEKEEFVLGNNLEDMLLFLEKNAGEKKITVLASGDPFLFGIGSYIEERIHGVLVEYQSGISSFQYLANKIGMRWEDMAFYSVHGRAMDMVSAVRKGSKSAVFTGKNPERVLQLLCEYGYGGIEAVVGENLSYADEKITRGSVSELAGGTYSDLSVLILFKNGESDAWPYTTQGIPDSAFFRGKVPMTKEEIRTLTLGKLRLGEDSVLWDFGAGTGSVSIECALRMPRGKVLSFEENEEAIALIEENKKRFQVQNIQVIKGNIKETIKGQLPACDRAFIGGSRGCLSEILERLGALKNVRAVVNAVTIETVYEAVKGFEEKGFETEVMSVSLSKGEKAGQKHLMRALNTIYIITGWKGETQ